MRRRIAAKTSGASKRSSASLRLEENTTNFPFPGTRLPSRSVTRASLCRMTLLPVPGFTACDPPDTARFTTARGQRQIPTGTFNVVGGDSPLSDGAAILDIGMEGATPGSGASSWHNVAVKASGRQRQSNTTVLFAYTRTRLSRCHRTARESTIFSRSAPFWTRSSKVSRWEIRATSCSMIGPSSRASVT